MPVRIFEFDYSMDGLISKEKKLFLVVVQCRFNSSRLPGKAVLPVCGIPMLAFLLRRLKSGLSENEYLIVLATTRKREDDDVAAWGEDEGVEVVRGEEDDVLKRYMQCLEKYSADFVVRVTADNPLTCPVKLDQLVKEMRITRSEYGIYKNLPYGAAVDVFSSDLLKQLDKEANEPDEREHINLFVLRNIKRFNVSSINASGIVLRPDLSVTVDTKEDWEKITSLFLPDEKYPWRISLEEAIKRMDSYNFQQ